ncbi:MAG: leucyl aminopeptidase [Bacteroidetes bacterium]|nr:leucyl aminopeptidase [Bacteroidota bacterium]
MKVQTTHTKLSALKADVSIVFFYEDEDSFSALQKELVAEFPVVEATLSAGDFKAKRKTSTIVYTGNKHFPRLLFVGVGKKADLTLEHLRRAAAFGAKEAAKHNAETIAVPLLTFGEHSASDIAQATIEGAILSQYKFDKYFTENLDKNKKKISKITLWTETKEDVAGAKAGAEFATILCQGVNFSRDLANAPNNEIYPETLAKRVEEAGKEAGFHVNVLNKKKIEALKMGGLIAVNQGSVRPPVFIVMEYNGGKKSDKPVILVGKGITFDTGGISIKPGAGMCDMKMDMHGAASVCGAMYAVAKAKLPINVVALVPSTENMPSGSAYVPGDVITFMNGKTAEIDNTDAEGRLVLADALTYADKYKPQAVIDLATLTGAVVVALGNITSGLMGTDDALKTRIKTASARTGEYVCELPLYEEYEELIKSDIADVKNSGGRAAGSITAGLFLKKFIGDYPWAHLDIAGTGIAPKATDYNPKGGTGVAVRLLVDMLRNW